jgi:ArsR family transcriptional regulator
MVTREAREQWCEVFRALASGPRLQILECLRRGPVRCREILEVVGLSQPAVSYHLAKLEHAGILVKEKRGTRNCYRISRSLEGILQQCMEEDGSWRVP